VALSCRCTSGVELILSCGVFRLQRRPKVADTAKLVGQSHLLHPSPTATFNLLNSTAALPDSIGRNLGLSYAQCDVGFPKLWPELQRTKDLFTKGKTGKNYGITQSDLDKVEENDGTRVSLTARDGAGVRYGAPRVRRRRHRHLDSTDA
jgi:hypothetical protein